MNFEQFRPGLEKALAVGGVGTHSLTDVIDRVSEGKAQIWWEGDAFILTEIRQYPRKKVLRFWLATGELDQVIVLHRRILEWAKEQGCEAAIITGRRGWTKALRSEGWAETMAVLTREL